MISRRRLLQSIGLTTVASAGLGGYAVGEHLSLAVTRYRLTPAGWPEGLRLRLALLADLHICEPWMGITRINAIVDQTHALAPDAVLLLGDYVAGKRLMRFARPIANRDWARALGGLRAPLGVHAVLGNHDWWDDPVAQRQRVGPPDAARALEAAGIPVYRNDAVRLAKGGHPFWIAGLDDQGAFLRTRAQANTPNSPFDQHGADDLPGTLRQVTDDAPVILMAHEPDVFPRVSSRVALTVCGHTHGGQVRLPDFAPIGLPIYRNRYLYGHVSEDNRHMIVSAGLGFSAAPVRFGVPPEIVIVELGAWSTVAQS